MTATIQPDTLLTASKFLSKVAGGKTFFIVPSKKGPRLVAGGEGNVAAFNLPCESFLESAVEIERDSLLNAVKNRKELTFKVDGGTLEIRSSGYAIDLAVAEAPSFPAVSRGEDNDISTFTLTQDLWEWVAGAIGSLKVTQTTSNVEVGFYVNINEKGAFAVAYDMNHMAFMSSSKVTSKNKLEFMMPFNTASMLVKDLPTVGTEIRLARTWVSFRTKELGVQLALMSEATNSLQPRDVYSKCVEVRKQKGIEVNINRSAVEAFVTNGAALPESKTALVSVDVREKAAKADLRSPSGKISAVMKATASKPIKFALSFQYLSQFLEKSKGNESVDMVVIPEAFAMMKANGIYYVAGLSNEETSKVTKKSKKDEDNGDE